MSDIVSYNKEMQNDKHREIHRPKLQDVNVYAVAKLLVSSTLASFWKTAKLITTRLGIRLLIFGWACHILGGGVENLG